MSLTDLLLHGGLGLDLVGLAVRLTALLGVPVNRRPSSATAWLLAIFLVPYLGLMAFLLIGNPKLPKRRREVQRQVNAMIASAAARVPEVVPHRQWLASIARLSTNLGSLPLTSGNAATLIEDYEDGLR